MKFCPECGAENFDEAKFCSECGADMPMVPAQPQNTEKAQGEKNKWIATILDFIGGMILYCLCGIGHILYLNLYSRGLILGAIGILISTVSLAISIFNDSLALTAITTIIGIALTIYATYDAYRCSQAINEGNDIPPLFASLNTESISTGKGAAAFVVCLVLFFIVFAAFAMSIEEVDSVSPLIDDDIISDSVTTDDDVSVPSGVQVKITCPVEWSASVGDDKESTHYEGSGDDIINIDDEDMDVIAAAVQKKTEGSDKLKVEIIKDGKTLDSASTKKDYGVVSLSAIL